jgi:hypothetical protein
MDTTFAIGWKSRYRIEGAAFVYSDNDSGRVTTILGYPTRSARRDRLIEVDEYHGTFGRPGCVLNRPT